MCLLAVLFQLHPEAPLVVAANRDEWLARPAGPLQVLAEAPRVLGGRDEEAGGTWLAVNEHGVLAALTNQPRSAEPGRRSRGELPLLLTRQRSAAEAVAAFRAQVRGEDYNPCWLLVGDRQALYYLPLNGAGPPGVEPLEPGLHVLENHPLHPRSPKARRVEESLLAAPGWQGAALLEGLQRVLASHERPEPAPEPSRPPALGAACVHAGSYGTRSSAVVLVPPAPESPPRVWASERAPCQEPLRERSELWSA